MNSFFSEKLLYIKCSKARCQSMATSIIYWNNPKVHSPERKKSWCTCEIHRIYLENYLNVRGFYLETVSIEENNKNDT